LAAKVTPRAKRCDLLLDAIPLDFYPAHWIEVWIRHPSNRLGLVLEGNDSRMHSLTLLFFKAAGYLVAELWRNYRVRLTGPL